MPPFLGPEAEPITPATIEGKLKDDEAFCFEPPQRVGVALKSPRLPMLSVGRKIEDAEVQRSGEDPYCNTQGPVLLMKRHP